MDEFRLIYFHRASGKEFRAKMITKLDYVILNPETGEKLSVSRWKLDKEYKSSPLNKRSNPKNKLKFKRSLNETRSN